MNSLPGNEGEGYVKGHELGGTVEPSLFMETERELKRVPCRVRGCD